MARQMPCAWQVALAQGFDVLFDALARQVLGEERDALLLQPALGHPEGCQRDGKGQEQIHRGILHRATDIGSCNSHPEAIRQEVEHLRSAGGLGRLRASVASEVERPWRTAFGQEQTRQSDNGEDS